MKKNNLVIISGPSGAGEDSIIDKLSKRIPIERVITTTTRKKRSGEKDGDPYYFINKKIFLKKIKEGYFFEWAKQYNNNYYGVSFSEIERVRNTNKIGVWKIDYKGVIKAKELVPGIISILITAPLEILEDRIRRRGFVDEEYIRQRMDYTKEWLKHKEIYDFEVVNEEGKLDKTVSRVEKIIKENIGLDK
ncbi:MAG: guanylate kinase [Candidatus Magasanikbacteria bacterium]|nr:guanylate kinase [Candidatus Magasanikbacteria bacterium]